ncbi:MAG: type IV pilus assembly protein PilM [Candidatus Brocadiia bacterium]
MAKLKVNKSIIGLDIGSSAIKAIELTPSPTTSGSYVVSGYGIKDLLPQQNIKDAIKEFFDTAGLHTRKVVTAVSGKSVVVRYITMPKMSDEELRSAIKYEASKYIPFEIEEVMIDCAPLPPLEDEKPEHEEKEMRVLLVAVKKQTIEDHISIIEQTRLLPLIIDVDCFALGNAFELNQKFSTAGASGPDKKVSAMIDIGATKTNVNVIYGLNSYFTREIHIAGNDLTEALVKRIGMQPAQAEALKRDPGLKQEEVKEVVSSIIEELCHEIGLSFDYFEHQSDKKVEHIYLSGGGSQIIGLDEAIESTFEKRPIRWDPCESLEILVDGVDPVDFKKIASNFAVATGLAARIIK